MRHEVSDSIIHGLIGYEAARELAADQRCRLGRLPDYPVRVKYRALSLAIGREQPCMT